MGGGVRWTHFEICISFWICQFAFLEFFNKVCMDSFKENCAMQTLLDLHNHIRLDSIAVSIHIKFPISTMIRRRASFSDSPNSAFQSLIGLGLRRGWWPVPVQNGHAGPTEKKAPNVLLFRCNPRKWATASTDLHNLKEPFETVRAQHFEYNLFQIHNYLIGSNSFQYKQCRLTLPSALHILMFPLTSAIFSCSCFGGLWQSGQLPHPASPSLASNLPFALRRVPIVWSTAFAIDSFIIFLSTIFKFEFFPHGNQC